MEATGKLSLEKSLIRPAHWADFDDYEIEIRDLMKKYLESSGDRTINTPEEGYDTLKDKIQHDKNYLVLFYFVDGKPAGLLSSDFANHCARILVGYLPPKMDKDENQKVIDQILGLYEKWAKIKKAKRGMFYTFRSPNAHKFMIERGWEHSLTAYSKEF